MRWSSSIVNIDPVTMRYNNPPVLSTIRDIPDKNYVDTAVGGISTSSITSGNSDVTARCRDGSDASNRLFEVISVPDTNQYMRLDT